MLSRKWPRPSTQICSQGKQETAVAEFISDYGFVIMGQDDGKCMPLLVLRDTKTKRVAYSFIQAKGLDP